MRNKGFPTAWSVSFSALRLSAVWQKGQNIPLDLLSPVILFWGIWPNSGADSKLTNNEYPLMPMGPARRCLKPNRLPDAKCNQQPATIADCKYPNFLSPWFLEIAKFLQNSVAWVEEQPVRKKISLISDSRFNQYQHETDRHTMTGSLVLCG